MHVKLSVIISKVKNIVNYVEQVLPPSENEQFIILVINKNHTIKEVKTFKGVSHSFISIDKNEITEFLINHKANFVIFAHTHPNHSAQPSLSDLETFNSLQTVLNALSIEVVENVIIGDNNIYSLKTQQLFQKKLIL